MACADCGCGACIENVVAPLDFTAGVLSVDVTGIAGPNTLPATAAADLLGANPCQTMTASGNKLFVLAQPTGWSQEVNTAGVTFTGAAMPATNAVVWTSTLTITNPSSCRAASVMIAHRRPAITMTAGAAANNWQITSTVSSLGLAGSPVGNLDARGTAAGNLPRSQLIGAGTISDVVTLAISGTLAVTFSMTFVRVGTFTANAANQLVIGAGGGISVQGVWT